MCAEQSLPFRVRVGEVWRHLRGSVLPSVDLAQDVSQHEAAPGPAPAAMRRNVRMMRSAK